MMNYGENESEASVLCEAIGNPTDFRMFCEEISGQKL